MLSILVPVLLLFGPVRAEQVVPATSEVRAEADRLSGEIKNLAARQVWAGVERKYKQALSTGAPLEADVHLVAAYAARERGNLIDVYERLRHAAALAPTKEVVDWLWDLDHNFGRVELNAGRKGSAELMAASMPLDPSRRQAVVAAIETCESKGEFSGLLPRGDYVFAGQTFRVEPGIAVKVEISPKARRQGLKASTIVYRELPTAVGQEKD